MSKAFAVLIGGGSLLHDRMTRRSLARVLDEVLMGRIWGIRTAFLAVGVGPLTTALGKRLVRMGVMSADTVTVRDQASRDLLVSVGVPGSHVVVTSIRAFSCRARSSRSGRCRPT
jgi:polysaccharide pyruvyl transferase WcaK-like protein